MPVPKANQRAVNKYVKNNYDRINVTMPKGKKDTIQARALACSQSVNAYINAAIDEKMERDTGDAESPQEALGEEKSSHVQPVPKGTLKAAREAAEATGESVAQFVSRAVETQAQLDKSSLAMGINPVAKERKGGESDDGARA